MKKFFIVLGIMSLVLILTPVVIYWYHFGNTTLSDKVSDWGVFGDYINGTINTIVAIISLFVLAWITYIVAKNSNQEARKQQLILRRMDAYQVLATHMINFNLIDRKLEIEVFYFNSIKKSGTFLSKDQAEAIRSIRHNLFAIHELHQCISHFSMSYGHLFEYDFNNEEFKKLTNSSERLRQWAINIEHSIVEQNVENLDENDTPNDFLDNYADFTNSLRKEMNFE
ncbi:MAG: hypothetical protein A3D31_00195 [Candidatus Fluviicola riflensis]|nr:MAG: hypothetical protein CHH17_05350 [Candidatus Fluviicola riflensis]OGS76030.1 MAG: hypothetical protein A3D31_00195 [Candidatus Fluviicola riflensis]OGS81930.1 MAG: hypothetical protein A2724_15950 [Fluviicola sp. RIFCSPHIGHO2_01_FULL_43_53]OGS83368.1 MAG: hypothetical protein A3E30_19115 [Fluviicola sp. RIFCSPHIGHO2_12_FULL_43_24]